MSVLHFTNPHLTPSMQVLTLLNPIGALLGFRRSGQWNVELAFWVCLGGALGGLIGPFLRLSAFADVSTFRAMVGGMLAFVGLHLLYEGVIHNHRVASEFSGAPNQKIETVGKSSGVLLIRYAGVTWRILTPILVLTGLLVGVISSTLGVGGGFLLVPIFVALYRFPMYVLVAATIPYVIVQSATGLLTFAVLLPLIGTRSIEPEWAWGFFAGAGGILGSWCAAKTQRFIPERILKFALGGVTATAGALYLVDMFIKLPLRI